MNNILNKATRSLDEKKVTDLSDECKQAAQSVHDCVNFALDTYMQYMSVAAKEMKRLIGIIYEQQEEICRLREQLKKDGEC